MSEIVLRLGLVGGPLDTLEMLGLYNLPLPRLLVMLVRVASPCGGGDRLSRSSAAAVLRLRVWSEAWASVDLRMTTALGSVVFPQKQLFLVQSLPVVTDTQLGLQKVKFQVRT